MFLKLGDQLLNLDHVRAAHVPPDGEVCLMVDHFQTRGGGGAGELLRFADGRPCPGIGALRLAGPEADAVRLYFKSRGKGFNPFTSTQDETCRVLIPSEDAPAFDESQRSFLVDRYGSVALRWLDALDRAGGVRPRGESQSASPAPAAVR